MVGVVGLGVGYCLRGTCVGVLGELSSVAGLETLKLSKLLNLVAWRAATRFVSFLATSAGGLAAADLVVYGSLEQHCKTKPPKCFHA